MMLALSLGGQAKMTAALSANLIVKLAQCRGQFTPRQPREPHTASTCSRTCRRQIVAGL